VPQLLNATSEEEFKNIIEPHLQNPRIALCHNFHNHSDIDVAIVDPAGLNKDQRPPCSQWPYAKRFIGNKLTIQEQLGYKYIICLPGNDYPSGLYWALVSNSVVLMPEPEWYTALDFDLTAWKHYIPLSQDLSDLPYIINWCRENKEGVRDINNNAKEYCSILCDKELRDEADLIVMKHYETLIRPTPKPKNISFAVDKNLSRIRWSNSSKEIEQ
jgi:hypothetical protein